MFQPRWPRGGGFLGWWVAASLVVSLAMVGGGLGRPGVTRGQRLARPTGGLAGSRGPIVPLLTSTRLPGLDPTAEGGPIAVGTPMPTPALAADAISPSNAAALAELARLAVPNDGGEAATAFSPDGAWLLATNASTSRLYAVRDGTIGEIIPEGQAMTFSPDGRHVLVVDEVGSIAYWDRAERRFARRHHGGGTIEELAFSSDGSLLTAVRSQSWEWLHVWDVASGGLLRDNGLWLLDSQLPSAVEPRTATVAFAQDWPLSAANAHVLDLRGGGSRRTLDSDLGDDFELKALAWSPDGQKLAGLASDFHDISDNNTAYVWWQDGAATLLDRPEVHQFRAHAWSPDGRWLAVVEMSGWPGQASVLLWDGRSTHTVDAPGVSEIDGLSWSPDSRLLAVGARDWERSSGTTWLWDAAARRVVASIDDATVPRFSPDGSRLVVRSFQHQHLALYGLRSQAEEGSLPDLRWVEWDYDNRCFNEQWWPYLELVNRGPGVAGPFSVQDRSVSWRIAGLGPGEGRVLRDWGSYPEFPVVIDPFDEVREQNEGNNALAPSPNAAWTPTPVRSESPRDPSAPTHHQGRAEPDRPLTQPPPCPTRTPVPTLTPAGQPPLPDLVIVDARWWEETIIRDGAACRPEQGGLLFTVTVRNDGDVDAGYFEVGGVGFWGGLWRAGGLKRGVEVTMSARLRFLPGRFVVDSQDDIEESREDNNDWTPPFNGTPTPALTPGPTLPLCLPTLTPTPIPTEALPDLRLEGLAWRPDLGRTLCMGPRYRLAISVRNAGRSPSGPFEVRAGGESRDSAAWFFDSLEPGELRENVSGPLYRVTWPIVVDYQEQVPESDEADNLVRPDPSLTATPRSTQPPTCTPAPRATTPTPPTPASTRPSVTPETPVSPSSVPPRARLVLPWASR